MCGIASSTFKIQGTYTLTSASNPAVASSRSRIWGREANAIARIPALIISERSNVTYRRTVSKADVLAVSSLHKSY